MEILQKCSFSDQICLKELIQGVLKDISKNGIQELNMPPIDPIRLQNIPVSVLGLINITLEDGVAKGIKECVIDKIRYVFFLIAFYFLLKNLACDFFQ